MTENQSNGIGMGKSMEPQLKANPFNTYRDPKTGEWKIVTFYHLPQTHTSNN